MALTSAELFFYAGICVMFALGSSVGGFVEVWRHVWPMVAGFFVFKLATAFVAHVLHYLRTKL